MNSISPVFTETEVYAEQVIALDQPEYYPIIIARILFEDGSPASMMRFRFTEDECKLIAEGADLIIGQPHHGPIMPMSLELAMPGDDTMAMENEYHNGPICTKCGYGPCMWCVKEIKPCLAIK